MRVVGAGLGRTGTMSLSLALERLLGGQCYHMKELFRRGDHLPSWQAAIRGESVDLEPVMDGYVATVDWPGAAFWEDLHQIWPEALVLLSRRADAETWWESANATVLETARSEPAAHAPLAVQEGFIEEMLSATLTPDWDDRAKVIAAYNDHNANVRVKVRSSRLLEWQPGDGWAPLCNALDLPVPDEPFPHANRRPDSAAKLARRGRARSPLRRAFRRGRRPGRSSDGAALRRQR